MEIDIHKTPFFCAGFELYSGEYSTFRREINISSER